MQVEYYKIRTKDCWNEGGLIVKVSRETNQKGISITMQKFCGYFPDLSSIKGLSLVGTPIVKESYSVKPIQSIEANILLEEETNKSKDKNPPNEYFSPLLKTRIGRIWI